MPDLHTCHPENRLRLQAMDFLMSGDIQDAAQRRRKRFRATKAEFGRSELDSTLSGHWKQAELELIPAACALSDPPMIPPGAAERLAQLWLSNFLQEAACTEVPLQTLARKYARLLCDEATRSTIRLRYVVPLANFETEAPFAVTGTIDRHRYKWSIIRIEYPCDPARHGFWTFPNEHDPDGVGSFGYLPLMNSRWLVLIDVVLPKGEGSCFLLNCNEQAALHRGILRALRLFDDGMVDGPIQFMSHDSVFAMSGRGMLFANERVHFGEKYQLRKSDVPRLKKFWRSMEKWFTSDPLPPRLSLGIEYFESSYTKYVPHAFLDLSIALEALFDISSEQTYRLPLRAAAFLEDTSEGVMTTYEAIRELWKLRNKIVHGSLELRGPDLRTRISDQTPTLRQLVRRSIVRHLELLESFHGNANDYEQRIHTNFEQQYILSRLGRRAKRSARAERANAVRTWQRG